MNVNVSRVLIENHATWTILKCMLLAFGDKLLSFAINYIMCVTRALFLEVNFNHIELFESISANKT